MNLFKEVADIKTADQLNLPTPEVEYHNIVAQPTEHQQEMVKTLSERASLVHSGTVDPSQDNMLKITSDGRKLGLDQRIVNQMLPDEPGTKVNQCVDNIMQIWRDGKADKLTQLVFCDISTPQAKAPASKAAKTLDNPLLHALEGAVPLPEQEPTFTVYDDIRQKLIAHTYEYTVREDIVMAMEELELTDAQAQALLESPSPLADVYRYFEKLETGHMDVIRDSIENRADDVCRAKEELRTTPVYPHSAAYAREHRELEQYRVSNNANLQCKESIEAAVREHFDGMYLSHDAAKGVIETYGMERVSMVLSNTVQLQDWDGRYSRRNKEWAKTIPNDNPETVRCGYALNSHPAVLDGFIDLVREEQQRSRTQREKLEPSRPSVRDKLKQELPAHKSAAPKKREPER